MGHPDAGHPPSAGVGFGAVGGGRAGQQLGDGASAQVEQVFVTGQAGGLAHAPALGVLAINRGGAAVDLHDAILGVVSVGVDAVVHDVAGAVISRAAAAGEPVVGVEAVAGLRPGSGPGSYGLLPTVAVAVVNAAEGDARLALRACRPRAASCPTRRKSRRVGQPQ